MIQIFLGIQNTNFYANLKKANLSKNEEMSHTDSRKKGREDTVAFVQ
jgi:hypothetical protein